MKELKTHEDIIELLKTYEVLELHIERNCGTDIVPYYITDGSDILVRGTLDLTVDDYGDFESELSQSILDVCRGAWDQVHEYRSLVAGTK